MDYKKLNDFDFQKNVKEFLIARLNEFSAEEKKILALASILGDQFDLKFLQKIIFAALH